MVRLALREGIRSTQWRVSLSEKTKVLKRFDERQKSLTNLRESVLKHPFLSIGFGLYWMQTILLFQSPYSFLGVSPFVDSGLPRGTLLVASSVVTYLVWAFFFRKANVISMAKAFPFLLATGLIIGASLYISCSFVLETNLEIAAVLYVAGSILIGCGTASICLETGRIFGYLGPQQVLYHGVFSLLFGSVGAFLLSLLPETIGIIILIIMPAPMVFCLWRSFKGVPRKPLYGQGLKAEIQPPKKFLITSAFQGLALGVMNGLLISNFSNSAATVTLGYIVAVGLLFFCAISIKNNFDFLIYRIGFPLMAAGLFIYGMFPEQSLVGVVFLDTGYSFQYLMSCSLCAYLAKGLGQPPIWIIGTSTACLLGGQLVGSAIEVVFLDASMLAIIIAFVLLLAALFMTSSQNLRTGWGAIRPGSPQATDDKSALEALAIKLLASEQGLSNRETEVYSLMVKGYNRKAIGKELFLAEETVKTHTGRIYQKLLVHSRQELIDMTKERADSLSS